MTKKITHKCKENDNEIVVIVEDGKVDEIWTRMEGEAGHAVFGINDMKEALEKGGVKIEL